MKKINSFKLSAALKILLLFGFADFFIITIMTGVVKLYVHPRIIPFMVFAAAVMIIMGLLMFYDLFSEGKQKANLLPLMFFVVPLLMAFALPPTSFESGAGTTGGVQLINGETVVSSSASGTAQSSQASSSTESSVQSNSVPLIQRQPPEITLQDGVLVLDDDNFYTALMAVYENLDKYAGTTIELVGFVYKDDETFAKNEFVPARMLMVCCAADMQPAGFLCRYANTAELKADTWVKVRGVIEKTEFEGETIPYIAATKIEETDAPQEAYIYPY